MKFILTNHDCQVASKWSQEFDMVPEKMKGAFIDTAADAYNNAEQACLLADRQALVSLDQNA